MYKNNNNNKKNLFKEVIIFLFGLFYIFMGLIILFSPIMIIINKEFNSTSALNLYIFIINLFPMFCFIGYFLTIYLTITIGIKAFKSIKKIHKKGE